MKWQMHHEYDLHYLRYPLKLLSFFDAYLDSVSRLCPVLKRSSRKSNYARGAVVLHLTFHAVELFLKGAILARNPNEDLGTHNIQGLSNRYNNLYLGKKYMFHPPFIGTVQGELSKIYGPGNVKKVKIFIEESEKKNPLNQRHRYPGNFEGHPWRGSVGFEPGSCLGEIKTLKADIARLTNLIFPANTV